MGTLYHVDGATGNIVTAGSITASGAITSTTGDITLQNQHSVIFNDTELTPKSVTLHAPTTLTSSYTLNWPLLQGGSNTVLVNDGSGNLSWSSSGGSGVSSVNTFTGAVSIVGTTNQVAVSNMTGTITLSTPQNIDSTASPTFQGLTVTKAGSTTLTVNATGVALAALVLEGNSNQNQISTGSDGGFSIRSIANTENFLFYSQSADTLALTAANGIILSDKTTLLNQSGLLFQDTGTNTVTVEAPTTITSSYTLKWPLAQSSGSQVLTNDGSGNLSWTTSGGSSSLNLVYANATGEVIVSTGTDTFIDLSATITPSSNTKKVLVRAVVMCAIIDAGAIYFDFKISRDGGATFVYVADRIIGDVASTGQIANTAVIEYLDSPATSSPVTYGIYARSEGSGIRLDINSGNNASSITLMEV